ncbi:MAG: M20 family metallopeptidase [Pseudoramibacter sp.]
MKTKKEILEEIVGLRHDLHRHPELSGKESWTKAHLMAFIADHTDLKIVDKGTWFYALYVPETETQGPIAFRADMDALPIDEDDTLPYASEVPGVSHRCGHDGHSAALAAAAVAVSARGKAYLRKIYFVFQPAEETGQGGEACAAFLKAAGVEEVYAFHNLNGYPENSVVIREGLSQPASEGLTIHLTGTPSHASAPEQGRNPAFVIAHLIERVEAITERPYATMVLCTVVNVAVGTKDFGISAGEGELSVTLRAEDERDMQGIEQELRQYAEDLADQHGLQIDFAIHDYFPETRNHAKNLQKVREAAKKTGHPVIEMPELWRASEDFGYYLKAMPGAIFYIGSGEDYPPLHTEHYDFNDKLLTTARDMFLALI